MVRKFCAVLVLKLSKLPTSNSFRRKQRLFIAQKRVASYPHLSLVGGASRKPWEKIWGNFGGGTGI